MFWLDIVAQRISRKLSRQADSRADDQLSPGTDAAGGLSGRQLKNGPMVTLLVEPGRAGFAGSVRYGRCMQFSCPADLGKPHWFAQRPA